MQADILRSPDLSQDMVLKTFNMTAHQYGLFFAGFDWNVYFCGTFRSRLSLQETERVLEQFWQRLERKLSRTPVAMIAVRERRTSGCGLPAIPAHWHILLGALPRKREMLLPAAKLIWNQIAGDCYAEPYNRKRRGSFYIAKLARGAEFEWVLKRLDRLAYSGPSDIPAFCQTDSYVPEHVRDLAFGETLVLRKLSSSEGLQTSKLQPEAGFTPAEATAEGGHHGRDW